MNTIASKTGRLKNTRKKAANGKNYLVSNEFKVGDIVAIQDTETGEVVYNGVIERYSLDNQGHFAFLIVSEGVIKANTLGSALVVKNKLVEEIVYHFVESRSEKNQDNKRLVYNHRTKILDCKGSFNFLESNSYRLKLIELGYTNPYDLDDYRQVCVWQGTIIGEDNKIEFQQWLLEEFNVRAVYCEEIVTLPYNDEEGGRNDVFFRVHSSDILNFAVERLAYGIRWWEDVLLNGNAPLYPSNIQERYPKTW